MHPKKKKLHLAIKMALCVPGVTILFSPIESHALAYQWRNASVGTAWQGEARWNSNNDATGAGGIPGSNNFPGGLSNVDTVTINRSSPVSVGFSALTGTRTIADLTLGPNASNSLNISGGSLTVTGTTTVSSGSSINNSGGIFNAGSLVNNGVVTINSGAVSFSASNITQQAGGLNFGKTGGANYALSTFSHGGGAVTLGANNNLVISSDYTNNSFGVGNAFNARAGISGAGLVNSSNPAAQSLSGDVSGGTTATPTMTFENVHVGVASDLNYQINNAAGGPTLRGAIQVTGLDSRLSGTGVTPDNWAQAAGTGTGNNTVSLTVNTAGVYAPVNQNVTLRNNFDNVVDQTLNINSSGGAAAYNLAAPNTLSDVVLPNQRVNQGLTQGLSITNTAPAGPFSEALNAGVSSTPNATASGAISQLPANSTDNSSLQVGVDSSSAGPKTGTVTVNYASDGAGTSELGVTNLTGQTFNVSGDVYRLATGGATPAPINVSSLQLHVGDTAQAPLTITNTAANDGFSEGLRASFGATSGAATNNGGVTGLIAAGGNDNSSLLVGVNTGSAGNKVGSVTVNYESDGDGTSGFSAIANGSQTVSVSGDVYNYADADFLQSGGAGTLTGGSLVYNLNFGSPGDDTGVYTALLEILNNAPVSSFTDLLDGTFDLSNAGPFGLLGFSPILGLNGGSSVTGLQVSFNTNSLAPGTYTGYYIELTPGGSNASGFDGRTADGAGAVIRLNLSGIVQADTPPPGPGLPEPATLWLLGSAGLGWMGTRRRNHRR